jgi:DNA-binding PucR family transcriptional regulator
MAIRARYDDSVVGKNAAAIIARLGTRQTEVARIIQRTLTAEITELRGDAQLLELLSASVEGNVDTIFRALQYEIPLERVVPPTAALEYARRLAQRGVPANALVRAYRLGQQTLLDLILTDIRDSDLEPGLGLDVFERMTTVTFRYIDWISQQVVVAYEAERDRWLENQNSLRAVRVREVLEASDVDVDAVTAAIRYPLRRIHLALVLWYPDDGGSGNALGHLERFLRDLTDAMETQGSSLFVAADRVTGWGWIPLGASTAQTAVTQVRRFVADRQDAPCVAVGTPLSGAEGFRRSHRQAQNARMVAVAAGTPARSVTAAGDPGLTAAALVGDDLPEAQAWVRETLGPLSADTENDARLRETLRVFLRDGCSYKAAADELNLHFNSVRYRVNRAIERRGRPIAEDRLDVEIALLMCQWFGAAALGSEASDRH